MNKRSVNDRMGRSNNQRRRTAKSRGFEFHPGWTKSKTVRNMRKTAMIQQHAVKGKRTYGKVVNKKGLVVKRKFRAGGYNHSGKNGAARGNNSNRKSKR